MFCLDYVTLVQLSGQFLKDGRLLVNLKDRAGRENMLKLQETYLQS